MNSNRKAISKLPMAIAIVLTALLSVSVYATIDEYVLNVPSNVSVVSANPALQLFTNDNTPVTSISFGEIAQGEIGSWQGYIKNTGNVALRTFSIELLELGSTGSVSWSMPSVGYLGVGQSSPVTIWLTINQTVTVKSYTFTVRIMGSPNGPVTTNIQIYAINPKDPYSRTWNVVFDRELPPYAQNNGLDHVGSDVDEIHSSGDIMSFQWNLTSGPHYLILAITEIYDKSTNPDLGTYNGTIKINGVSYAFTDLDGFDGHMVKVDFVI